LLREKSERRMTRTEPTPKPRGFSKSPQKIMLFNLKFYLFTENIDVYLTNVNSLNKY